MFLRKKMELHEANEMLNEFVFEHKYFPLNLNDNENYSLYHKESQQHFHKTEKNCVFIWKTKRGI